MNPYADILAMLAFCRRHYRSDALSSRREADTTFNPYTNTLRRAMKRVVLPPKSAVVRAGGAP